MKVLVTGTSGRFAPHLVYELLEHQHEVVLFSRKKPPEVFSDIEWVSGDCNSITDCLGAIKGRGFDAIQHAAAKPGPTDAPSSSTYDDPDHQPHVTPAHKNLPENHVFEDIMQLVDWVRDGKPSIANLTHARHVIDIIDSAYLSAASGRTLKLQATNYQPLPLEALAVI